MKKSIKLFSLTLILLFCIVLPVTAKEFPAQIDVQVDKEWYIKFNFPVESSTLQSNISLWRTETDPVTHKMVNTEQISITPVVDLTDPKTVIVKHTTPFIEGATYKLRVEKGIQNLSGKSLADQSGLEFTVKKKEEFTVTTNAYSPGDTIPLKYGYSSSNISLPIEWKGLPDGTKSLAVVMYDLHPIADNWIHWSVINIPVSSTGIQEGASGTSKMPANCIELNNDFGSKGYGGPCPPSGSGKHEYKTIVYALSSESINLSGSTSLYQFQSAISGKILAQAEISGYFEQ